MNGQTGVSKNYDDDKNNNKYNVSSSAPSSSSSSALASSFLSSATVCYLQDCYIKSTNFYLPWGFVYVFDDEEHQRSTATRD